MADANGRTATGGRGLDGLFGLTDKRRLRALLDMIERTRRRPPPTVRFALAGIVSSLDADLVQDAAAAVGEVIRAKIARMRDDE